MVDNANPVLQEFCDRILQRHEELQAVVISTSDGIPIGKAWRQGIVTEAKLESGVAKYFSVAADQASKMGLGQLGHMTALYDNIVLCHINMPPLVVSCVADSQANIGIVLNNVPEIKEALEPIRITVEALERDVR
mmetsp:Transcript_37668/g.48535  ORF Transcript_37668/g.48535 Transcript_37668/m.48535 type:complete len:135 (-) Transcript_37668:297-701(-)